MTRARREAIVALTPAGRVVVDVGADHGYVALALGAIATERMPQRARACPVRWVIADGLAPFRTVDVAIVAGMGARTIAGILQRGPRPAVAVLHAQDDPPWLRQHLAATGWRIDAEALAPEAGRFAEILRAVPGREEASGLTLHYGPRLLERGHPLLVDHLRHELDRWTSIAHATRGRAEPAHTEAGRHVAFLQAALASAGGG